MPAHDLVDGVERRPDPLAFFQPVEPRGREGAQIFAAQLLLAFGEVRHH